LKLLEPRLNTDLPRHTYPSRGILYHVNGLVETPDVLTLYNATSGKTIQFLVIYTLNLYVDL